MTSLVNLNGCYMVRTHLTTSSEMDWNDFRSFGWSHEIFAWHLKYKKNAMTSEIILNAIGSTIF